MEEKMTQRPDWFSRLDISCCEDYFNEVETFAREAGRTDDFYERLQYLVWGEISDNELACWGRPCKVRVRLYKDFAPQSFEFVKEIMYKDETEWTFQFNGGLIFHGSHDNGGDGGAPTYSVNLTPQDGWSVHT
jgi:hypothetical protein